MCATLLERGLSALAGKLSEAAGGTVLYSRGSASVAWAAAFGRTEFSVDDNGTVSVEYSDRDFIGQTDTLTLNGFRITPQRGDRITVVQDERIGSEIFEVLAPGGAQPFRLCDSHGRMIRVHTKRVST